MGRQPLRPSERARCSRVATHLADVVHEMQLPQWGSRLMWLRGLALHLKALKLRTRDLDQENGRDAIAAIARTLTLQQWRQLAESNAHILGARWSAIVDRAGSELRKRARTVTRENLSRARPFDFCTTSPTVPAFQIIRR